MIVKLLTEHHLEFLSLKGGCRGSPESTHVKMQYCWKSHAVARFFDMTESCHKRDTSLCEHSFVFYDRKCCFGHPCCTMVKSDKFGHQVNSDTHLQTV